MKIVPKISEGVNPHEVLCTTYQMRNPFLQFSDGFANELDAMCYAIHMQAARLLPRDGTVLDLCCGRGLLIPFLRYHAHCKGYVGVDIQAKNASFRDGQDPRRRKGIEAPEWGFEVNFLEANVASCARTLRLLDWGPFDLVVYTSSIEHMQPDAQRESLREAAKVSRIGAKLYLTCPTTEEGGDPWETRYKAHVYEPRWSELSEWLRDAGWNCYARHGLVTSARAFRARLEDPDLGSAELVYDTLSRPFALVAIAATWPQCATEVAYICKRQVRL